MACGNSIIPVIVVSSPIIFFIGVVIYAEVIKPFMNKRNVRNQIKKYQIEDNELL